MTRFASSQLLYTYIYKTHMFFVSGCRKKEKSSVQKLMVERGWYDIGIHKELSKSYRDHTAKNWNLWLSHMIWALCLKCYRILLRWGIYLNQSYKEGTREGAWDCVFTIEQPVVATKIQNLNLKSRQKTSKSQRNCKSPINLNWESTCGLIF